MQYRQVSLLGGWAFAEGWRLHARLPTISIRREERGRRAVTESGIGDVSVYTTWRPAPGWSFLYGMKLPTGDQLPRPRRGVVPATLIQVGSGTLDPLFGMRRSWQIDAFQVHTGAFLQLPLGESDADLAPGDLLHLSTGVAWQVPDSAWTPALDFEGLLRGTDELGGRPISNTGSSIWALRPSVHYAVSDTIDLDLAIDMPILRKVTESQVVPGTSFTFGATLRF